MIKVIRSDEYSTEDFLWLLYNKFGYTDLAICHNYTKNGDLRFSKWIKYEDLLAYNPNDTVPEAYCTKKQFIDKATHRTIMDIELMIDIDDLYIPVPLSYYRNDKGLQATSVYKFSSVKAKAQWIILTLNRLGIEPVIYWTGSKSYHLSLILTNLRGINKRKRETIKEELLWFYGGDMAKKGERCMISLENSKHYRSKAPKVLVEQIQVFM